MTTETVRALFVTQANKKPTRWQRGFIAVYLAVGVIGLAIVLISWLKTHELAGLFLFVGAAYLLLGLWFVYTVHNERACARLMLQALDDGGSSLAWVYIERTSGQRESTSLHYCFTSHKHGELFADDQTVHELFHFFTRFTAQLSTGYTPELQKQFRRVPNSLKTNPVRGSQIKYTEIPADNPSNGW